MGPLAPAAVASAAAATATQPTFTLERDREAFPGYNSVSFKLAGLPPFTSFDFSVFIPSGWGFGPIERTTDASGSWVQAGFIGDPTPGTWTATVVWSAGTLTRSLDVDCSTPASKEDCEHGGWQHFGFKNQGQCIAFVSGGKSQAGS